MQYDGNGKLGEAIAALCGCSPKSSALISNLIGQAKDGLGITSKSKKLPDDVKLEIWQWHYDRLNPIQDIKQDGGVQDSPVQSVGDKQVLPPDDLVQDVKQVDSVQNNPAQSVDDTAIQDVKQDGVVYDVKQSNAIQDIKQDSSIDDYAHIHFGVVVKRNGQAKRTTVMLEGYLVKALQRKHALPDNAAIRAWIEQAVKDSGGYDDHEALTKQVKRLIIESFV